MPRLRLTGPDDGIPPADVIPFPRPQDARDGEPEDPDAQPYVLAAFAEVSRRMNDLARILGCPGYFEDENDDRPTAA